MSQTSPDPDGVTVVSVEDGKEGYINWVRCFIKHNGEYVRVVHQSNPRNDKCEDKLDTTPLPDKSDKTIQIHSTGGGFAVYEFTVEGSLKQGDSDDEINGNRAYGHVGPKRGTDTFNYTGDITGFTLVGPARVRLNGQQTDPSTLPTLSDALTADDFSSQDGENTLTVESKGGGVAAYEFSVSGKLETGPKGAEETVRNYSVYGHVGPQRGVDNFHFTGDVTSFSLAGPATVSLNGEAVAPSSNESEESIEFIDCSTVRIQGEFETVILDVWGYFPGVGDYFEYRENISGETVISLDDGPAYSSYIDSVHAFKNPEEALPGGNADLEASNPRSDECDKKARPVQV